MSTDVLVLNASYEPLARVSWQRAVCLLVTEKADVSEAFDDKFVRSPSGEIPWPKEIVLRTYVKLPYYWAEIPWSKRGVLKRDSYRCAYCAEPATTVDHIMPTSRGGGPRDWLNTVACCVHCNQVVKDDKTPEEAGMELLYEPYVPHTFRRRPTAKHA